MKKFLHTINFLFLIFSFFLICLETTILAISSSGNRLAETDANGVSNKCFDKERLALLDFKARLEDPDDQLSTWRAEDSDCCKWIGVACDNQTGHVTTLDLSNYYYTVGGPLRGLGGEISPSLVNLSYLNRLDLSFNSFHGTIPSSIGLLYQLRYLRLSHNWLHGIIPPETGVTNFRNLSLDEPRMIENLDWLSNLSHLQHFEMNKISLAKANHWVDVILSLRNLTYLSLQECDLSEVMHPHSSFGNSSLSSSIQFLYLTRNNLNSSMYPWLLPLTSNKLLSLDLSYNMLDEIPKDLGNLCSLTSLSLGSNSAVVNFPDSLINLSGCTSATLRELLAYGSQFTGSLSNEIKKFSSLELLILSHNHLNGTMSEEVWELPNLQSLDVSSNSLVITPNIGKSKLSYLNLSNNSLVVIPSKAHMLNEYYIEHIELSACKIGPLFPKWIQAHKNLTNLDISNNKISNRIPVEFWNIWPSQLVYLNLSSNNISGKVPDLSSNFGLYSRIDLSSNNFYGPIPIVAPTLLLLNLSKNRFYGGISFVCQIVSLSFLDLSHNSLTGQLPDCLWHLKELRVLNLEHNNFFGRLPTSIGYLVRLQVLNLYNNNFTGELPLDLKNCKELNFLNLGVNKFFGNVPVWIGENLSRLYGLSLRSNNFFGPIPLQLCYLVNLQILDLSMNNIIGTIPSCLNNLTAIVQGKYLYLWRQNIRYPLGYTHDNVTTVYASFEYVDNAIIGWQGNEREFTNNLGLLVSIDLSSNNLTGQIPSELVNLHELLALNLSKNALFGEIPRKIE
ncbi:hypothetical protein OSB04_010131 [Centaurea solstitialis]|uniref:Leucine-rich repeat-containing N-terminal plant-type domain-containing protein n=1 Tax=Centaurea solstitialis TaxID=347529 RepID=A0AA38WBL5_9ASTR|nr:hypothetical protein OSB04_010131 [Centaurea solstitialis]